MSTRDLFNQFEFSSPLELSLLELAFVLLELKCSNLECCSSADLIYDDGVNLISSRALSI